MDTTKTVRYVLNKEARYLWDTPDFQGKKMDIPPCPRLNNIFVNILEIQDRSIKLKLFLPNGEVMEGWNPFFNNPVSIFNMDSLFDGRFNQ